MIMSMPQTRIVGVLCLSLLAACASVKPTPPQAEVAPAVVVTTKSSATHASPSVTTATASATVPTPAMPPAQGKVKAVSPNAKPTVKASAPAIIAAPSPPALDLKGLEAKLKETKAIGVFTKLSLKNQVDDLLDQIRAYHNGQRKTTLSELRQPYDTLILKVLTLLQDGDPPLAQEISTSREAIWGVLADPIKFASLN
jgi:hypothetical protein